MVMVGGAIIAIIVCERKYVLEEFTLETSFEVRKESKYCCTR